MLERPEAFGMEQLTSGWRLRVYGVELPESMMMTSWVVSNGRAELKPSGPTTRGQPEGLIIASSEGSEMSFHAGLVAVTADSSLAAVRCRLRTQHGRDDDRLILAFDTRTGDCAWLCAAGGENLQVHQDLIFASGFDTVSLFQRDRSRDGALAFKALLGLEFDLQAVVAFAFGSAKLAVVTGKAGLRVFPFRPDVGLAQSATLCIHGEFADVAVAGDHVVTLQAAQPKAVQVWDSTAPAQCLLMFSSDSSDIIAIGIQLRSSPRWPASSSRATGSGSDSSQQLANSGAASPAAGGGAQRADAEQSQSALGGNAEASPPAPRSTGSGGGGGQGLRQQPDKDENEHAEVEEALARSSAEADQQEQAFVTEAIMRSKVDAPMSDDRIVVLRLKRMGCAAEVTEVLLNSPHLAGPIARVFEAGCEVTPAWTPAKLLVPLTLGQIEEAGIELRVHHIVAHEGDFGSILEALKELPRRRRPAISAPAGSSHAAQEEEEEPARGTGQGPASAPEEAAEQPALLELPELEVEHTFLHFRIPKDISEASCVANSAPCGDADGREPENPRRWKRT